MEKHTKKTFVSGYDLFVLQKNGRENEQKKKEQRTRKKGKNLQWP